MTKRFDDEYEVCQKFDMPKSMCAHCRGLLTRKGEDKSQQEKVPTFLGLLKEKK